MATLNVQMNQYDGNTAAWVKMFPQTSINATATIGTTWSGSGAPYTQTISNVNITSVNTIVEVYLAPTSTAEQVTAYQLLNLQDGGTTNGSFTLRAFGTLNTISIPVNLIIRNDVNAG